jgi:hypothetical protein
MAGAAGSFVSLIRMARDLSSPENRTLIPGETDLNDSHVLQRQRPDVYASNIENIAYGKLALLPLPRCCDYRVKMVSHLLTKCLTL